METGNKVPWYRSWKWGFFRHTCYKSRVGWQVRALIMLALMLTGFSRWALPSTFALTHQLVTLGTAAGMVLACFIFIIGSWEEDGPSKVNSLHRLVDHVVGRSSIYDGWPLWRAFQFANFAIIAIYAIRVYWSWSHVWGWMRHWLPEVNLGLVGSAGGVGDLRAPGGVPARTARHPIHQDDLWPPRALREVDT